MPLRKSACFADVWGPTDNILRLLEHLFWLGQLGDGVGSAKIVL